MIERAARVVSLALAALGVLLLIGAALNSDVQPDADAYWLAAQRIREGMPLYSGPTADETEIYRYAPWFAYAWVPLTYLGEDAAFTVWRGILVLATLAAVWPLLRRPSPAAIGLAILLGGLLLSNLPAANVTALVVGLLVVSLRTRAAPVAVAIAASLKFFPIILVAGFLAERRWGAALLATVLASALWLHILTFDTSGYAEVGDPAFYTGGVSLYSVSPVIWAAVAGSLGLMLLRQIRLGSRWSWLTAAMAIPLAVPRVWLPDAGYILAGLAGFLAAPDAEVQRGQTGK